MLKYGAGLVVRALVELGLVFLLAGAMLVFVAYRVGRLFVTPEPDRIDRLAAQLGTLLGRAAIAQRAAAAVEPEPESDWLTPEEEQQSKDFWRSVIV